MAQKPLRLPPHFPFHDLSCTSPQFAALCSSPSCFLTPPSAGTTASGTPNQLFDTSHHNTWERKILFSLDKTTHHALLQAEHLDRSTFDELIPHFQHFFAGFPSSSGFCCDFLSSNFFLSSTLFNSLPRSLFMFPHLLSSRAAVRSWRPFSFSKWSCKHFYDFAKKKLSLNFWTPAVGERAPPTSLHICRGILNIAKIGNFTT